MATSARNRQTVQLRLALNASRTLIPLALFALAFAGALFVLRRPGPPTAVPVQASAGPRIARASAPALSPAEPRTQMPAESSAPDEMPSEQQATRSTNASLVPETVAASDGPPEVDSAAGSPPVADDVAQAISTLREGSPADRVLAIQTLAATGHSGRALSRVRQTLRFAASDLDPDVAARAQEAYDSLLRRDDP